MSQTYIAIFVQFAVILLPMIGVRVGSDELTAAIQTFMAIGAGFWVLIRRFQAGDVSPLGFRR